MAPNFIAQGLDYAWGRPRYGDLKGAGAHFVMRYISRDPAKDLLAPEKKQLDQAGVPYGLVYETTAGRARDGFNAGLADAERADGRVKSLGLKGMPVYFAVDFDASGPDVEAYIRGAAKALGHDRTGVYGGYRVVAHMHSHGACKWLWQTYAWSAGRVHPQTHIYQFHNGVTVAGVSSDWNKITAEGYGSLRGKVPKPPKPRKYGSRSLKQGDSGTDVHELQRLLTTLGSPHISVDGVYGPQTEKAKHVAMVKLGWPASSVKAHDKSRSIGAQGLRYFQHPETRPQSYKDRSKK